MKPLKGLKVLDLTRKNGYCTLLLADYGAQVIKVEKPGEGDPLRYIPPTKDSIGIYQRFVDRGKKSICLDIKSAEGKEILKQLVRSADILVENFKTGTMEALGLGYEQLEKLNPRLIYAKLSAFGTTGAEQSHIGYEITAQAKSGVVEITGFTDEDPFMIGVPIASHYAANYLCSAILMAYFHVKRTGIGQYVESSLWEAMVAITEDKIAGYDVGGEKPTRSGNAHSSINPFDVLKCKDGFVALGVSTDDQWQRFCEVFNKDEWFQNPNYSTNDSRGLHYFGDLRVLLEAHLAAFTKAEIVDLCASAVIPASGCSTIEEALKLEQLQVRNMVVDVDDHKLGTLKMVGKVIKFHQNTEDDNRLTTAPALGEHTIEILSGLGYSAEQLSGFMEQNIITADQGSDRK